MRYPVRLFLGNEEVEFSTPPDILFNYSVTELSNPTIVKNAYSKTVTIEGTAQNNRIFGHIYNLERIQGFGGTISGEGFNPLVKTDFTLYYNGSVYESGYFKLDEIRKNNNNIEYDISLFGGLGDWLYRLSFKEDGSSMELSDLTFDKETSTGQELGFTINKETVAEAWENMWQFSSKWDTINFAPCSNGKPSNLSADKFLINNNGITMFGGANAQGDYSMGTSKNEHTEWETFDLRSYLQRPVIRVRDVIGACCNPDNNGGYTVNLDTDFFNTDNPYYWNSWMTLPMLTELDVPATVQTPLAVTSLTKENNYLYSIWDEMGNVTNVSFEMQVKFTPSDGYSGDTVVLMREYDASGGFTLHQHYIKKMSVDSFIMVQMLGYNADGQVTARSNMFRLIGSKPKSFHYNTTDEQAKITFESVDPKENVPGVTTLIGQFTKKNGEYVFCNTSGDEYILNFSFPSNAEFSDLKVKIVPCERKYIKYTSGGSTSEGDISSASTWSSYSYKSNSWQRENAVSSLDRVEGSFSYIPYGATGITESYEGFWSGRKFTKKDLLTLGVTPAQFILSYAKIFGLYFVKDVESKTISILSRHNFYKRDNTVNINDIIDKGSDIKITPVSSKYQYYDFGLEQVESEAGKAYKNTYGRDYGVASVNTGYEFEQERKSVLDGNIFKGGIDVMEKNKYYLMPTDGVPCLVYNGFDYWYKSSETGTTNGTVSIQTMDGLILNPDGLKYYDFIPKVQFHSEDNEATDGSMVLLFCEEKLYNVGNLGFHLTDDTQQMYAMNDGQPCWMINRYTTDKSGHTVALDIPYFPVFLRNGYRGKYISYSMDMGSPMTTYVPNKFVSGWQNIFYRGWESYIYDLYNVNTRLLKCKCLLRERPNPEWLRRFYWFDNCYWRINSIKDWNISSFDETEMEFIKVQNIDNYDNIEYTKYPIVKFNLDSYSVGESGGTISGYVYVSDGTLISISDAGVWYEYSNGARGEDSPEGIISPLRASGAVNIPITINVPANQSRYSRTVNFSFEDSADIFHPCSIQQAGSATGANATISPTALTIGSGATVSYVNVTDVDEHGWELSTENNWIQLGATGGTGSETIAISAGANEQPYSRTANISFRDMTSSIGTTVSLSQEGATPHYDEVKVFFTPGNFVSYIHDNYNLVWRMYKGTFTGTLLYQGQIDTDCFIGETYSWGSTGFEDTVYEPQFGTIQYYCWVLEAVDSSHPSTVLFRDSGIIPITIPEEPEETYYEAVLPDVEEY